MFCYKATPQSDMDVYEGDYIRIVIVSSLKLKTLQPDKNVLY